jgi:hypothetical protein
MQDVEARLTMTDIGVTVSDGERTRKTIKDRDGIKTDKFLEKSKCNYSDLFCTELFV